MCRKSVPLGKLRHKPTPTKDKGNTFYQGIFPSLETVIQFVSQEYFTTSAPKSKDTLKKLKQKDTHQNWWVSEDSLVMIIKYILSLTVY